MCRSLEKQTNKHKKKRWRFCFVPLTVLSKRRLVIPVHCSILVLLPLFDFECVLRSWLDWDWSYYQQSIELVLPIIPRSPPDAIAWQEQCFLGLLRLFRCLVRASYNWASWPHLPSPHSVLFSFRFSVHGTAFHFRLDGTECNGNITVFWLLLYM